MFKNSQEMKVWVKDVLTAKNIQKLPRTLSSRMDDYMSAEFFGLDEKREKYGHAIVKFCNDLKAREYNALPETVKSELLPAETLKARALIHARRVREASELRTRLAEKQEEIANSEGRIPFAQREEFGRLLVELQNVIASEA